MLVLLTHVVVGAPAITMEVTSELIGSVRVVRALFDCVSVRVEAEAHALSSAVVTVATTVV